MTQRPRFISIEGGEGTGKTTQLGLLADAMRRSGTRVVTTREPGGSAGAEAIRQLLLEGGADRWGHRAEALLFAAARADHVERVIRPALAQGSTVLCDRFVDSSRVYQTVSTPDRAAADRPTALDDAAILSLHDIGSAGLMPDITILLVIDAETALRRVGARGQEDRIGRRALADHDALQRRFLALAAREPGRFRVIDASGSPAMVHARVLGALEAG